MNTDLRIAIGFARLEMLELESGRRTLAQCPGIENVAAAIAEYKGNPPPPKCFSAGCNQDAAKGSVLCEMHIAALLAPLKGEG